jgi:hypothetical protein
LYKKYIYITEIFVFLLNKIIDMKRLLLIVIATAFVNFIAHAVTYTSNVASGNWNSSSSWTPTGIPGTNDDVIISSGHNITWGTSTNHYCRNLTINAGGTLTCISNSAVLYVYGSYTNNGTEGGTNNGTVSFQPASTPTISGTGTFNSSWRWTFNSNRTIQNDVTAIKNFQTKLQSGCTVTNLGNITINSLQNVGGTSTWINGNNATLRIKNTSVSANTLNVSSFPNTVEYELSGSSTTLLPQPIGNTYHHLRFLASNIQNRFTAHTQVNGNYTQNGACVVNLNGFNLSVSGNMVFNGNAANNFNQPSGSTVTLNGSSAQVIQNTSSSFNLTFNDLIINNTSGGVSFSLAGSTSQVRIINSLTVQSGNLALGSNRVVLVSDATQTARIGQSNGTFSGSMIIQRHISARNDGYSDMSSPVVSTTFADWDNELLFIYNYNPPSQYPSCYAYEESPAYDYVAITSPSTSISRGVGYEVYLDEDGNYSTPFSATTIDTRGTPNRGNINIAPLLTFANDGWNLVGNPYASHINWNALHATLTNVNSTIMFYDETIGDFESVSSGDIAPHQGFWVEVTGTPTFTFTEAIKSTSNSSSFRSTPDVYFTLRMKHEGDIPFTSNTKFRFNENSSFTRDNNDLSFKGLPHPKAPNLYTFSEEGKKLRINAFNPQNELVTINLGYKVGVEGFYTINPIHIDFAEAEGYTCILLEDKKTGTFINLYETNYRFYATPRDNEQRFALHFSKSENCKKSTFSSVINDAEAIVIYQNAQGTFADFKLENYTNADIIVTDLLGKQISPVQQVNVKEQTVSINIPAGYTGIALISIRTPNNQITKKLYFK